MRWSRCLVVAWMILAACGAEAGKYEEASVTQDSEPKAAIERLMTGLPTGAAAETEALIAELLQDWQREAVVPHRNDILRTLIDDLGAAVARELRLRDDGFTDSVGFDFAVRLRGAHRFSQ